MKMGDSNERRNEGKIAPEEWSEGGDEGRLEKGVRGNGEYMNEGNEKIIHRLRVVWRSKKTVWGK